MLCLRKILFSNGEFYYNKVILENNGVVMYGTHRWEKA